MANVVEIAGGQSFVVVEREPVPVLFTDWILTAGHFEGVINIALGSIDHSAKQTEGDPVQVHVASKLRMSVPFAERLHKALGDMITKSVAGVPPSQEFKAN